MNGLAPVNGAASIQRIEEEDFDFASSKLAVQRLVGRIITYWRGRGYQGIIADVVEVRPPKETRKHSKGNGSFRDRTPIYTIVSNIVNGYPPRSLPSEAT